MIYLGLLTAILLYCAARLLFAPVLKGEPKAGLSGYNARIPLTDAAEACGNQLAWMYCLSWAVVLRHLIFSICNNSQLEHMVTYVMLRVDNENSVPSSSTSP